MGNQSKPRRRWFRFTLRTLFVLLTVFGLGGGWLVSQINLLKERRLLVARIEQCRRNAFAHSFAMYSPDDYPGVSLTADRYWCSLGPRLLGDTGYHFLRLPQHVTAGEAQRYVKAFPEAFIVREIVRGPRTVIYLPVSGSLAPAESR